MTEYLGGGILNEAYKIHRTQDTKAEADEMEKYRNEIKYICSEQELRQIGERIRHILLM